MRATFIFMSCAVAVVSPPMALAQGNYPTKPITLVVPSEAGGATDIVARAFSTRLSQKLGQSVLIDNRGGASGVIGTEFAVRSKPDGYTLLVSPAPASVVVPHYRKVSYDTLKDFAPVTLIATSPNLVVVNPNVKVNDIKELIALAKKDPKALSYGSSGYGAPSSLAGQLFKKVTDSPITEVPYKGSGPATTALLGDHIQMMFAPINVAVPYVEDGRLKPLAVTSSKRSKVVPNVPTLLESGIKVDVVSFYGVLAPAGTPQPIIDKLQTTIAEILKEPEVRGFLEKGGADVSGNTPAEFGVFLREQYAQFGDILKQIGIAKPQK